MTNNNKNQQTTAMGNNNANSELTSMLKTALSGKLSVSSPVDNGSHELVVKPSDLGTKHIATLLLDAAYEYDNHVSGDLTVDTVSEYLEWVFVNRINYLSNNGKNDVHPRNIEYPTICFDALSAIRRYDGSTLDGIVIIPVLSETLKNKWMKDGKVKALANHDEIARKMKVAGIKMTTALPMDRTTTDRTFFEVQVAERITTSGSVPSEDVIFSRMMYEFKALSALFGVQKMELILQTAVKQAMYDIVRRYVTNRTAGK